MITETIKISKELKKKLDKLKRHPRETYNQTIQYQIDIADTKGQRESKK
jgi:predicted transcriptional regulator